MEAYGIALTKKQARAKDVNPIWYIDQTKGREWLSNPMNFLIDRIIENGHTNHPFLKLTPFIEQFGEFKDFHWEREWRCVGDFHLPPRFLVIAPEAEHEEFRAFIQDHVDYPERIATIDAHWSLEETIARMAGFNKDDLR